MKLTTESIWNDLAAWKREAQGLHHEPYELYRDFYIGGDRPLRYIKKNSRESDEHWLERLGRLVGANYCAPIVNKPVQAEYGGRVRRSIGDAELQARLDAIARANALHTFQLKTARQRAIDGCAVVQVYWDPNVGGASAPRALPQAPEQRGAETPRPQLLDGGVRLKHILPEHFFPIVTEDCGRLDAVIIDRSDHASRVTRQEKAPSRVEIYTPQDIAVYEDGVRINEPMGYGALPFVVFNGRRLVGDVFGHSMLRGIAELNHALNESLNNVLEILRFQAFSLLVIQGGLHGLPVDADGRPKLAIGEAGFLNIDAEGRVYFADPNPKIGEVLAVIERMIGMMYETGSIPVAVVQPQQSHAESAASRQIQFMPLVDLVEELITFDLESERDLIEKALLVDATHRSGPTDLDEVRGRLGRVDIEFPRTFLPVDDAARFELLRAKRDAGLLTRRMMLAAEHPEMSEEELEGLEAELGAEQ
ncbi:MAG TPA: hypothetical protein VNE39_20130 [Planctomycetota bacterium]|nr:hypothetical protein [Planctomycetota bacterium]